LKYPRGEIIINEGGFSKIDARKKVARPESDSKKGKKEKKKEKKNAQDTLKKNKAQHQ
jgi:hypothetical protein